MNLDKTEERILKYINGFEEVNIGEFAGYMPEISDDDLEFYINELVNGHYIKRSRTKSSIWLDDKGKQYLNKLLSSEADDSIPEKKDIKKRNKKNTQTDIKQKKINFGLIISIVLALCGFYAYQYNYKPEINITNIKSIYDRGTKANNMRMGFNFTLKNTGKSKTKKATLYSAFPRKKFNAKSISIEREDFTETDLQNLSADEEYTSSLFKDIDFDEFVESHNLAQGIWLNIVLRWEGDNLVYFGRTFEKHILLFLVAKSKDNRMIFDAQQAEENDFTYWFLKKGSEPEIFKTWQRKSAIRLMYGDASRFD